MSAPAILALDFDGVVCDGRPEYFETAWQAYVAAWPRPLTTTRPAALAERFSALRPLIESGWEMPLMVHALLAGVPAPALESRHGWLEAAPALMKTAAVSAETLGRALNRVRDEWFARDAPGWLAHHRFYPNVAAKLVTLLEGPTRPVIVTTKTERFARALLVGADPRLSAVTVIGREPGQPVPKPDILRRLADSHGLGGDATGVWFVEDMLETLEATAKRPDLSGVRLFLCEWGYNTPADRARVGAEGGRITLLTLERFSAPLETWYRHEPTRRTSMPEYIPSPRDWVREQVELYERSGGTQGTTLRDTGLPVIVVTHSGNKTGAIRKTPLMLVKDGANYVLVGSMGGAPKNPVWVYNLRANPVVEIRDHTAVQTMRVREVGDEAERARLWKLAVAAFPPYDEYQAKTPRRIPLFVAEPKR